MNPRIIAQKAIVIQEQEKLKNMIADVEMRKSFPVFQAAQALFNEGFRTYRYEYMDDIWDSKTEVAMALVLNKILISINESEHGNKVPELADYQTARYLENLSEEEGRKFSIENYEQPKPLSKEEEELEEWYYSHTPEFREEEEFYKNKELLCSERPPERPQ